VPGLLHGIKKADFVIKRRWAVIFSAGLIIVWVFMPWNWIVERTLPEGKLRDNAFSAGKLGHADRPLTVRDPVVAEIVLPRFLAP
jgi:hypothetical protein